MGSKPLDLGILKSFILFFIFKVTVTFTVRADEVLADADFKRRVHYAELIGRAALRKA